MNRRVAILLIMGSSLAFVGCEAETHKLVESKPPTVVVSPALTDYVIDFEDFTGRTEAVFSIDVRARVTGYLDKVRFKDGEDERKN